MAKHLFLLRVPNDMSSVPLVSTTLRQSLKGLDFKPREVNHMELVVEEACANVIEHAYPEDVEETFDVEACTEFGFLRIRIEDHGEPYNPLDAEEYDPTDPDAKGLGVFLMRKLAHEIRYVNLGTAGKALDVLFRLPGAFEPPTKAKPKIQKVAPAAARKAQIRRFRPEDAKRTSVQAYHALHYSPFGEHLYVGRHLEELNEQDILHSFVIADNAGKIYGHASLQFDPRRAIPELGQAFVVGAMQEGNGLEKLMRSLFKEVKKRDKPGTYVIAPTNPTYIQTAAHKVDCHPCCLLPGLLPEKQDNRPQKPTDKRLSAILLYKSLQKYTKRKLYAPTGHKQILSKIYDTLDIPVRFLPAAARTRLDESTQMRTTWSPVKGTAHIVVEKSGFDLQDELKNRIDQFRRNNVSVFMLDLPLDDAFAMRAVPTLEKSGFFFTGIIPNYLRDQQRDVLRLLSLYTPKMPSDHDQVVSDFGDVLAAYIRLEMERRFR